MTETKGYDASPSRTLQRRRELLGSMMNHDIDLSGIFERPQTVESMHHTSIASDLSENRLDDINQDLLEIERQR